MHTLSFSLICRGTSAKFELENKLNDAFIYCIYEKTFWKCIFEFDSETFENIQFSVWYAEVSLYRDNGFIRKLM